METQRTSASREDGGKKGFEGPLERRKGTQGRWVIRTGGENAVWSKKIGGATERYARERGRETDGTQMKQGLTNGGKVV